MLKFDIEEKLCTNFVRLGSLALGHILSELRALKWRPCYTHLRETILQVACPFSTHTIRILSFILSTISIHHFHFVHFCFHHVIVFPFMPFNFHTMHHCHLIMWFSFLPLEVNLHTYLTTWLSSCPVGIFPRSYHIFVKIQTISKVSPLKWNH